MLNILKINLTVKSSCLSLLIIKSNLEELLPIPWLYTVQYSMNILYFSFQIINGLPGKQAGCQMLLLTWLKVTSASKKSCCFYWLGLVESVIADWMKNLTCCFLIGHQNPKPANPQRMSLTTDKKVLFTYLYPFQNCSRIFPHPPPPLLSPPPPSV